MKHIKTANAPLPIGAYSQAVYEDSWLYISGQVPLVPETGKLIEGDFKEQVRQVLRNLLAVLEAAGGSKEDLVKTNVYMMDLKQFGMVNDVYQDMLAQPYPARAAVQVAGLPAGAQVEIEAVAYIAPHQ